MQLKYNRQPSIGSSIVKNFNKTLISNNCIYFCNFLIEKINFPSPEKKYEIDITNEIKKL